MWLPHHHVAFEPPAGAGLPQVDVTLLGDDGATEETEVAQIRPLCLQPGSWPPHLTLISWTSGTNPVVQRPLSVGNLVSTSCGESKLGLRQHTHKVELQVLVHATRARFTPERNSDLMSTL